MVFTTSTILLVAICLIGAIGYVAARWKAAHSAAVLAKAFASTSFVALALVNGALETGYGRAVLAALVLSWAGDMLLLSRQSAFLLAGIATFFLAHIAFVAAFAGRDLNVTMFAITLVLTGILALVTLKWLWKYLSGVYRAAVPIYLAAVAVMVSLAAAASFQSMPAAVGIAAGAFAVSDISVARDRFIESTVLNKAWGLPLYYIAQVLFAISVTGGSG